MKQVLTTVILLVLCSTATTLHAQRGSFSLNQLETLSSNIFEQLDADENGSITLEEIDLLKEDPDKALSGEELVLRQRRLSLINSYFWTEEEIDAFEVGDTNRDGSMHRDEFDNLESNVRTHVLELGLKSLDKDKNGSVEANEFSAHLDNFEEWDANGNGAIDREEMGEISNRRFHTDIRRRWIANQEEHDRLDTALEQRVAVAEREARAAERKKRAADESEED